jgi:hypothetical protein
VQSCQQQEKAMTDITSTGPIIDRRSQSLRLELPKLAIGKTIAAMARAVGGTMGAMAHAVGDAFEMGYSTPYQTNRRRVEASRDEQGRDPSW